MVEHKHYRQSLINSKIRRFNKVVNELRAAQQQPQVEEEEDDYDDSEEQVNVMPAKQQAQFKQQLSKNRAVPPKREQELNKKVEQVAANNPFDVEADELGLNDAIPGLPEDLED